MTRVGILGSRGMLAAAALLAMTPAAGISDGSRGTRRANPTAKRGKPTKAEKKRARKDAAVDGHDPYERASGSGR